MPGHASGWRALNRRWRGGLLQTGERSTADLVVLNTCTVTVAADEDVRRPYGACTGRTGARILVTGCYAQRAPRAGRHPAWNGGGNSHKHAIPELIALAPAGAPYHGNIHLGDIHVGDIFAQEAFLRRRSRTPAATARGRI